MNDLVEKMQKDIDSITQSKKINFDVFLVDMAEKQGRITKTFMSAMREMKKLIDKQIEEIKELKRQLEDKKTEG